MYVLASHIKNLPVISLLNGQIVATAGTPIVSRDRLELMAVYCFMGTGMTLWRKNTTVIMTRDIREIAREGLVIDSLEDIEDVAEIVRLKDVVNQKFNPVGLTVVNESGQQLGKVEDFTINLESYKLQKLYVKQSLMKNLLLNSLVIDRAQIVDVTNKIITVRDAIIPKTGLVTQPIPEA